MAASDPKSSGDAKRRRILDAALQVSQERGVHAARMEEVAARAQVSKGTLYRFFESKEDLFLEMMIDSYQLARRAREAEEQGSPSVGPAEILHQRLVSLAKVLDVAAPRSRVHYQAFGVVADDPNAAARLDRFLSDFHRERHDQYEELIRAGQLEGVFRSDIDPGTVAHAIGALLSGFIYRASFDPAASTPEALQACLELVFSELLGFTPEARPSPEQPER
jgi:AcrR family transcriptional regulator